MPHLSVHEPRSWKMNPISIYVDMNSVTRYGRREISKIRNTSLDSYRLSIKPCRPEDFSLFSPGNSRLVESPACKAVSTVITCEKGPI